MLRHFRFRPNRRREHDTDYRFRATPVECASEPIPALTPEPAPVVEPGPRFDDTQIVLARLLSITPTTIRRWERAGLIWEYDPVHAPEGHFVVLASGRKRYSMERVLSAGRERRSL